MDSGQKGPEIYLIQRGLVNAKGLHMLEFKHSTLVKKKETKTVMSPNINRK